MVQGVRGNHTQEEEIMGKVSSVPLSRELFFDLVMVNENLYQVTLRPDDSREEFELAWRGLRNVVDRLCEKFGYPRRALSPDEESWLRRRLDALYQGR